MLPAQARLRRSQEFRAVLRGGVRAGRRRLVLHLLPAPTEPGVTETRAGLVVSKAVGNAVMRHRVSRQLRHLLSTRLGTVPQGSTLVVRALPAAAGASSAQLGADLDAALRKLAPANSGDNDGPAV